MLSDEDFTVPAGDQSVQVRIIDSTARIDNLELKLLMEPPYRGLKYMPTMPSWSFLIEHPSGKKALFDLGVPKSWKSFPPAAIGHIDSLGWNVRVEEEVIDILSRNGVRPEGISSIIWSHWHWDHIGEPSRYPSTTELVVGPGFKDAFLPAYPANQNSPIRQLDITGRSLQEINFEEDPIQIGRFRGFDFFGDGSFYILDTPGHAVGHLAGLARTTSSPHTFIFMGGDLCHHSGEIRPSKHLRIPREVVLASPQAALPCPGALFEDLQRQQGRSSDEPFFDPSVGLDIPEAIRTIKKAQDADKQDNVWFIYAHDPILHGIVDFFPLPANKWKEKNWRSQTLWAFLRDFEAGISK
ncbi:hypothetical protein N7523_000957 [Penicillium sp. IBT 18751x]|nr:hypothetical protein N7523_000957 [Penicillium sp. IBT 18751x]